MELRAVILIIVGAIILLWPQRLITRVKERRDRRLAELRSGAEERYFEEERALVAYPPPRRGLLWRLYGALLVVGGIALLLFR
jgi:hypothetical protein